MSRNHGATLAVAAIACGVLSLDASAGGGTKELDAFGVEVAQTNALWDACPGALIEAVPCFVRLSQRGNAAASKTMAELYADPASAGEPTGLKASPAKSIEYIVLAIEQGSLTALKFIPPKPYKWRIGMSGKQVLQSIDGAPTKVVRTETAGAYSEDWFYPAAVLHFERSPISDSNVVLTGITTVASK